MEIKHILILVPFLVIGSVAGLPNIILILTDDQDLLLDAMVPMNITRTLIGNEGMTMTNAFVNTPICCPSRGTILTGRYPHNTGILNNSISGGCSSPTWQKNMEPVSIATILKQEKDYVTFYGGKYLNQYGKDEAGGLEHVPKGYDWWIGLFTNSKYYNYSLSINGTARRYTDEYLTDVLSNYSIDFLENRPKNKPLFMIVAPPAPHAPFTPAPRHQNVYDGIQALRTPSFNFSSSNHKGEKYRKHWLVEMEPKVLPEDVTILDQVQRHRWESLLAVDEMVGKIMEKLESQNILNNTYVIFMSDNGFHIGQFTEPWDKRQPYETDIRIPFLIRGPGISKKTLLNYPITAVDVAPTILDLANVSSPADMDGESFSKLLFTKSEMRKFNKEIYIEYWGEGNTSRQDPGCQLGYDNDVTECVMDQWCKCQDSRNNTYSCIVELSDQQHFKFCQFQDREKFIEAYNLKQDPYELENLAMSLTKGIIKKYETKLENMKNCSGANCRNSNLEYHSNNI